MAQHRQHHRLASIPGPVGRPGVIYQCVPGSLHHNRQALTHIHYNDIEERAERRLAGSALIQQVSLVIAPHHGSNTSSSQVFVDTTEPRFVVFSSGFKNRWGHPKIKESIQDAGRQVVHELYNRALC